MSTDFMNPSDDLIAGLQAGRGDRQNEIDNLEAENAELKAELEASVQRYKLHQHLWVDAETEVDKQKHDEWIIKANQAIGDKK